MIIVIASDDERKLVKELGYDSYPIVVTGIGGVNVIRALKNIPRDEVIVNIGYAGSNHFQIGEKLLLVGQLYCMRYFNMKKKLVKQ